MAEADKQMQSLLREALDFASEDAGNWASTVSREYREGFRAALRCAIEAVASDSTSGETS